MQKKKAPLSAIISLTLMLPLVTFIVWNGLTEGNGQTQIALIFISAAAFLTVPLLVFIGECRTLAKQRKAAEDAARTVKFGPYEACFSCDFSGEESEIRARYESERLFRKADSILNRIYAEVHRVCFIWKETDAEGQAVTEEFVKAHYTLTEIFMTEGEGGEIITNFTGCVFDEKGEEMLGGHMIVAEISSDSDEINFSLEEA
ncbi:MAG: hypothetical protein IKW00_01170 [Clostridia bacterium]|nr:hypothetical protein [Clostridia bacterium]